MTNVERARDIYCGCKDKAFFCICFLLLHLICSCDNKKTTKLLRAVPLEAPPAFP